MNIFLNNDPMGHVTEANAAAMSSLVCRNIRINGRRTSIKLESSMWHALEDICRRTDSSLHDVCSTVERETAAGTFTSRMRVFILDYFRDAERRARGWPGRVRARDPTSSPPPPAAPPSPHDDGLGHTRTRVT